MSAISAQSESRLSGPVLLAIWGQVLISAGTHLAAKQATFSISPLLLVTLRQLLSALVFVVLLLVTPGPKIPPREWWGWLLRFSLLLGPINQGLFMYGLSRSKATHGGLLYALTPIGVYLLSVFRGRESLQITRLWGIAVAFFGVLVLLLGRGFDEALGPLVGDLFILGAVGAWVVWTAESRPFAAAHGGFRSAAWSLIVGAMWMIPFVPWVVTTQSLAAVEPHGWWSLGYLIFFTSVVSYVLWNFALARVEASRVAVFANVQPVATALLAWAWLREPLGWEVAIGGVLVLLGVRLAQRGRFT